MADTACLVTQSFCNENMIWEIVKERIVGVLLLLLFKFWANYANIINISPNQ